jgi:hypothetical protein
LALAIATHMLTLCKKKIASSPARSRCSKSRRYFEIVTRARVPLAEIIMYGTATRRICRYHISAESGIGRQPYPKRTPYPSITYVTGDDIPRVFTSRYP